MDDGEYLAYAFQITPRRKQPGLIQGEIWLDQGTGVPVRQFGRLVKSRENAPLRSPDDVEFGGFDTP